VIKSEETIAIEFERRMRDLAPNVTEEAVLLQMNPRVSAEFTGNGARVLHQIEHETGKWFHFEGSEGLPLQHFKVLMEASREQVLERALPFREGEEVYVEIIEPHMYSAGDAVAKVDGYIISVKEGESAVGQKRLVRIEEVGRTAAIAVLIDEAPVKRPEPDVTPDKPAASARPKASAKAPAAARTAAAAKPAAATPPVDAAKPAAAAELAAGDEAPATDETSAQASDDAAPTDAPKKPAPRRRAPAKKPVAVADVVEASAPEAGAGEAPETDSGENGADSVESTVRRRGRRGGRRRSTSKTGTASTADESSSE
jgi:ribonuclease G